MSRFGKGYYEQSNGWSMTKISRNFPNADTRRMLVKTAKLKLKAINESIKCLKDN